MTECGHDHPDQSPHGTESAPDAAATARPSVVARPVIAAVRAYQHAREGRPSPCRFVPSCSTYAVEALAEHGVVKGSWMSLRRLARCHPWGGQGYDPVPARSHRVRSTWNTADVTAPAPTPDQKVP